MLNNIIILALILCAVGPVSAWVTLGSSSNVNFAAGNLSLDGHSLDYDVYIEIEQHTRSSWRLSISHFSASSAKGAIPVSPGMTGIWILRGSSIPIIKIHRLKMLAGLGLNHTFHNAGGKRISMGSLGFRFDSWIPVKRLDMWEIEAGISYKSGVYPLTDRINDRIGLIGVAISRQIPE